MGKRKSGPPGRIVLVANNFPPVRGGSAVVYGNLARCAPDRIIVLAPRVSYADSLPVIGWREHDRLRDYRVIRLALLRTELRIGMPGIVQRLRFLLHDAALRTQVAAVLGWLVAARGARVICVGELQASGWIIHLFAWVPGIRTIAYVHGEEVTTEDGYDRGHARARRALLACNGVVVVSRFTWKAVGRLLSPAAADHVTLIENGVDRQRFTPSAKADDLLAFYGLAGHFTFVSVCRLLEKKGIDHALRAFAQMRAQAPDSRFLIVGGGPFCETLQALSASLGLADAVVFAGQVPDEDLVDHYRLGDVFVMPNRELPNGDTEGFGLVFLEANGCGIPVIAGRDGGSTDAVHDGVNGLVVDGHSVPAIAAAMQRLHDDAALRGRLREQGLAAAAAADWAGRTAVFLRVCDG